MPINIDDRYENVDFTKEPQYTFGALPDQPFRRRRAPYEATVLSMSEKKLREAAEKIDEYGGLEEMVTRIYDQGQEGSCVGNAAGQGMEIAQATTYGKKNVVPLSAISLYKQIARSAQSGAVVSDGLEALKNTGILPLDTQENCDRFDATMPHTGFSRRFPDNWKATARMFRVDEYHPITSVDGILMALARQMPVMVGREGHSVCYTTPKWDRNQWKVIYVNSWGDWGFGAGDFSYGFGVDTISQIRKSANWAYTIRSVLVIVETI